MAHLVSQIKSLVGEDVNLCYQCEKCTSGCPVAFEMDMVPAQIMHASQLNLKQNIFKANTIWLCVSCETCTTRCPQSIEISRVMDGLRIIARREKVAAKVPMIPLFYTVCLVSLRVVGCMYDTGVAGFMRFWSATLVKDMPIAIELIKKGKLSFFPRFRNIVKINNIVRKVRKIEGFK